MRINASTGKVISAHSEAEKKPQQEGNQLVKVISRSTATKIAQKKSSMTARLSNGA